MDTFELIRSVDLKLNRTRPSIVWNHCESHAIVIKRLALVTHPFLSEVIDFARFSVVGDAFRRAKKWRQVVSFGWWLTGKLALY